MDRSYPPPTKTSTPPSFGQLLTFLEQSEGTLASTPDAPHTHPWTAYALGFEGGGLSPLGALRACFEASCLPTPASTWDNYDAAAFFGLISTHKLTLDHDGSRWTLLRDSNPALGAGRVELRMKSLKTLAQTARRILPATPRAKTKTKTKTTPTAALALTLPGPTKSYSAAIERFTEGHELANRAYDILDRIDPALLVMELLRWEAGLEAAARQARAGKRSLPHGYDLGFQEGREDCLAGALTRLHALLGEGRTDG